MSTSSTVTKIGLVISFMTIGAAAHAQSVKPACTDNSRECLIKTINLYFDGLETGDFSLVPFEPRVMRWENGFYSGEGEAAMAVYRGGPKGDPTKVTKSSLTERRYFVDLETKNIIMFDMLGAGRQIPMHHTERFKVEGGRISEVEAIVNLDAGNDIASSAQPMSGLSIGADKWENYVPERKGPPTPLKAKPFCTDDSRACMIKTAASYLDGTMNYDLSKVPFASDWVRTENGEVIGTAKAGTVMGALPKSLNWIGSHEGTRYWVDPQSHDVIIYTLYRSSGRVLYRYSQICGSDARMLPYVCQLGGRTGPVPVTMHMAMRLRIEKGLISQIEEIYVYNENMISTLWPAAHVPGAHNFQ